MYCDNEKDLVIAKNNDNNLHFSEIYLSLPLVFFCPSKTRFNLSIISCTLHLNAHIANVEKNTIYYH